MRVAACMMKIAVSAEVHFRFEASNADLGAGKNQRFYSVYNASLGI